MRVTYKIVDYLASPEKESLLDQQASFNFLGDNASEVTIPKLLGDVRRLKQVLINLIKNALKFTLKGSIQIKVCYQNQVEHYGNGDFNHSHQQIGNRVNSNHSLDVDSNGGNHLLIVHIKDTGKGISKDDLPKLFTRFGKLQRTAKMNS